MGLCGSRGWRSASVISPLLLATPAWAQSFMLFDDINSEVFLRGLSGDGSVLVGHVTSPTFQLRPVRIRWRESLTPIDLRPPGGSASGYATAASHDGAVIVGIDSGVGFRWTQAGGQELFPGLRLYAVSADGLVLAGNGVNSASGLNEEACRMVYGQPPVFLGAFQTQTRRSRVSALTPDGVIGVGSSTSPDLHLCGSGYNSQDEAVVWAPGTMVGIGHADPANHTSGYSAVSADGSVAVGSAFSTGPGGWCAYWPLITRNGSTRILNTPSAFLGATAGSVLDVSANGTRLVGSAQLAGFNDHAVVWDASRGWRTVESILAQAGVTLPSTVFGIKSAEMVSDDGRVIAGQATLLGGATRAWVGEVPLPCIADTDDGGGTGTPDGGVTIADLVYYLTLLGNGSAEADVDDGSGTGRLDGGITIDDLIYFLSRFASGC